MKEIDLSAETSIVDESSWSVGFRISPFEEGLGHNDHALPWNFVLLDKLPQNSLGVALRVGIGCVERLLVSSYT